MLLSARCRPSKLPNARKRNIVRSSISLPTAENSSPNRSIHGCPSSSMSTQRAWLEPAKREPSPMLET